MKTYTHTTRRYSWSRRVGEYNGDMIPIPLSQANYVRIAPFARMARDYTCVLEYKTAACMFTTPILPSHLPPVSSYGLCDEYLSMFLLTSTR
jgi:hypothetical protein